MANLPDTASTWETGVYQIEVTDPVVGGTPDPATGAGMVNIPHLQLARRTQWLRDATLALQNGAGYRDVITTASSMTLTAADMGECLVFTGTATATLTLPAFSAVPNGAIEFVNTGTASLTVACPGSDMIDNGPGTVASIVIPPNQSLKLIRATGSSLWHPVSVTAAGLATSFGSALAANGWQRLPSGLIMQWGGALVAANNVATSITLPIAFPTAGRMALCVFAGAGAGAVGASVSMTQVALYQSATVPQNMFWLAIGH